LVTYISKATDEKKKAAIYLGDVRHFSKFICMLADKTFNKLEIT
jgi:hypothetical protein